MERTGYAGGHLSGTRPHHKPRKPIAHHPVWPIKSAYQTQSDQPNQACPTLRGYAPPSNPSPAPNTRPPTQGAGAPTAPPRNRPAPRTTPPPPREQPRALRQLTRRRLAAVDADLLSSVDGR